MSQGAIKPADFLESGGPDCWLVGGPQLLAGGGPGGPGCWQVGGSVSDWAREREPDSILDIGGHVMFSWT